MGVAPEKISFLADPTGEFAHEFELAKDYSDTSLMTRSERFSMLVKDGKVSSFQLVQDAGKDAELLLSQV
jgi:peroxiredoxin